MQIELVATSWFYINICAQDLDFVPEDPRNEELQLTAPFSSDSMECHEATMNTFC